jgi:hypothetical protein
VADPGEWAGALIVKKTLNLGPSRAICKPFTIFYESEIFFIRGAAGDEPGLFGTGVDDHVGSG